jgi:hypothetical protein
MWINEGELNWRTVCQPIQSCSKKGIDLVGIVSFTPEEIETFKKDHSAYQRFRKGGCFSLKIP